MSRPGEAGSVSLANLLEHWHLGEGKNLAFGSPLRYFLWFARRAFSACVRVRLYDRFQGEHGEDC